MMSDYDQKHDIYKYIINIAYICRAFGLPIS